MKVKFVLYSARHLSQTILILYCTLEITKYNKQFKLELTNFTLFQSGAKLKKKQKLFKELEKIVGLFFLNGSKLKSIGCTKFTSL